MAAPSGVMHCGLKTLLVIVQPAGAFAGFFRVSVLNFQSRKSPESSAVVGMVAVAAVVEVRTYFHCSPTKKNNLSCFMGPPSCQAGLLKRSGGFRAFPVLSREK